MRICHILLAALAVLTACEPSSLFPGDPRILHEPRTGRHRGENDTTRTDIPPGEHVFLTAVRFPDGYAWELDTCAVDGPVWIDLWMDGTMIRSYPAGASVDPDMHRFTGGHLYADYSTPEETVVLRDGAELFRFPGREAIRGFLVREDGVHTLGEDRDGSGFTHRVDGREVFRSESGSILGSPDGNALSAIGEDVFYACRLPSERGMEYRVMQNAEVLRSIPEGDGVRAFGFLGGKVCRVQSARRRLSLWVDDRESSLGIKGGEALLWCRLLPWGDEVLALLCVTGAEGKRFFLQTSDGRTFQPAAGDTVSDVLAGEGRMGWTVTGADGDLRAFRWSDGGTLQAGTGAFLTSGRCALLREGHLLLALTGRSGTPNRFQKDAASQDLPFNGYFTSITVE